MNDKPHVEYEWRFLLPGVGLLTNVCATKDEAVALRKKILGAHAKELRDTRVVRVRVEEVREEGQ